MNNKYFINHHLFGGLLFISADIIQSYQFWCFVIISEILLVGDR